MKAKFGLVNRMPALLLSMMALLQVSNPVPAAENNSPGAPGGAAVDHAAALVGTQAPAFTLTDSNGTKRSLADYANKIVVLEWTNFDCPYVEKHYNSGNMQKLQKSYISKGVVWCSICSSADGRQGNYPPAKINELIKQNNAAPTAYLFDADGSVGHAYGVSMTPHIFVINQTGKIVYSGAIDDNASADISDKAATGYAQKALDETIAKKPVSLGSTKAVGCSVKYKS